MNHLQRIAGAALVYGTTALAAISCTRCEPPYKLGTQLANVPGRVVAIEEPSIKRHILIETAHPETGEPVYAHVSCSLSGWRRVQEGTLVEIVSGEVGTTCENRTLPVKGVFPSAKSREIKDSQVIDVERAVLSIR